MSVLTYLRKNDYLVAWALLALFVLFHLVLVAKTFVIDQDGNMRTAAAGYGDIPFHMTQVSKFAYQEDPDLSETIFAGERMRYAFLVNFLSGMLLKATGNWELSMHLPTMTMLAAGTVLLFLCYRSFLRSHWMALAAVVIFFLGAGWGDWHLFTDQWFGAGRSFGEFTRYLTDGTVSTISKWNAVFPQQNIDWGAPLSLVFLHQRAFFFGFFLFAAFLYLLERFRRMPDTKTAVLLGLTLGIGPLAHYHSFIAMSLVLGLFLVFRLFKKELPPLKPLVIFGGIALVLALPQVGYLAQGKEGITLAKNAFIDFRLGWMAEPTIGSIKFEPSLGWFRGRLFPIFKFTWVNFGVVLPLAFVAFAAAWGSRRFRERYPGAPFWSLAALAFYGVVQMVRFQPWDYDNNKILVYFQLFAAPAVIAFLVWVSGNRRRLQGILVALFLLLAVHAGVVDQIARWKVPIERMPVIFDTAAQELARAIHQYAPEGRQILTSSTHLNPVNSLAGRPVLVGYPGWLWTRRIGYADRESDLKRFYADPDKNRDVLEKYHVRYVLLDPTSMSKDWGAKVETFDKLFIPIWSKGAYVMYDVAE